MTTRQENATLRVRQINGRNGPFCVGDLNCDLGEFKVKDPILDQFEEGVYQVTAWIERLYLGGYNAYGRNVTEMRAQIADLQVITEESQPAPAELEPDPIDEPTAEPAQTSAPQQKEEQVNAEAAGGALGRRDQRWDKFKKPVQEADAGQDASGEAAPLFEADLMTVIEHGEAVKLDPTINRALLRQQTSALKARGYRFDAKRQTWFSHEEASVVH